jgi:hypothetical protein
VSPARRPLSRPAPAHEPDLSVSYKRAIERAIRWAWAEVRARWPADVTSAREERITEHLQRVLNEFRPDGRPRAPGMALFDAVNRGAKVTSVDGAIEKAPDLVFRPPCPRGVANRSDWGWFVECKIIGGGDWVQKYVDFGVRRFASGAYAHRMPSAAMLAYVRDRSQPHATLVSRMGKSLCAGRTMDVAISRHRRHRLSPPCVDIEIMHIWLDAAGQDAA